MTAVVLLLCTFPVQAQEAGEAYFHRAAQQYIAENVAEAERLVNEGLQADPDHPKLLALREKLREQKKAQSQSDDANRQDGSSQQQGGQRGGSQEDNQQQGEQRGPQGPQQRRSGGKRQPQSPETRSDTQPPSAAQEARRRATAPTERRPEGLSREQALRILRALEGQEKQLLREVENRSAKKTDVDKDW